MRFALNRLLLGLLLIALASGILLVSDLNHRVVRSDLPRVAIFQFSTRPLLDEAVGGVLDGLKAEGFVDGQGMKVERFNAENDLPTANTIARSIVDRDYDLVITASTPILQVFAGANQSGKVNHVFCAVTDPFGAGVGISRTDPLEHPKHLAGIGTFQPVEATFRIAKQLYPELKRVGEAWNPAEACSEACTVKARAICKELGIELVEANVDSSAGVRETVNSLISRGVQAVWIGGDNTVEMAVDSIVEAARKAGIPVFSNSPANVGHGLLFALGADYVEVGKTAGVLAGKILKGLDPATVRIEDVMPQYMALNLGALKGLRDPWRVPPDLLASAAEVLDENGVALKPRDAVPVPKPAAGREYKIGLVYFGPDPGVDAGIQGLLDGLARLGFIAGKNLQVRKAHAQGEIANIPQIIRNYDNSGLDLIVPLTTPCLTAALSGASHTPVVFTVVYDPIAAGAGASYEKHHANVTGVGSFPPVEETMATVQRVVPGIKVLGTLYNPSEANSVKVVEMAREVTKALGIRLEELSIANSNEAHQAAQVLVTRGAQAFWITGDNTALQAFTAIAKVAQDHRLPLINNDIDFLPQGALVSVGVGFYEAGLAAAEPAARVLGGRSPGEIPMANVVVVKRGLNFAAARQIGYSFPAQMVDSADVFANLDERLARPARIAWLPLPDRQADRQALEALLNGLAACGLRQHKDFEMLPVSHDASLVPDLTVGFNLEKGDLNKEAAVLNLPTGPDLPGAAGKSAVRVARLLAGGSKAEGPSAGTAPAAARSTAASGQTFRKWNIHFVNYVEAAHVEEALEGFFQQFRELGMVDGRDYSMKITNAQGDMATLMTLIDSAVTDRAELIIVTSTPTLQAALKRAGSIPILFTNVANPVLVGAGQSFEKHLPNVTGISTMSDFNEMVRVVKECLPSARTIGTLFVPSEINSVCFKDELAKAAEKVGMKLISMPVSNPSEVPIAASSLSTRGIEAYCQISDNLCDAAFAGISRTAHNEKKPLFAFVTSLAVQQGAAIAVARDYRQGGRDLAARAVSFLRGASLSGIPFRYIDKTLITINFKNAELCGLRIPPPLLARADRIIR